MTIQYSCVIENRINDATLRHDAKFDIRTMQWYKEKGQIHNNLQNTTQKTKD
jgi:hypothetical protein